MLDNFFELENKYNLKSVKIRDLYVWPFLRIYFGYKLVYGVSSVKIDKQSLFKILSSVFSGFLKLFGRYDYLFFSDSEQRREMDEKYVDRFDFVTPILPGNNLFFEILFIKPRAKKNIPTKNRASRSLLYILEYILIQLLVFKKINGEKVLEDINRDFGLSVNYKYFARRFLAQYLIGRNLARIYKPKAVFFITPYTNLGYVVAFKERGIKVIEMQHGVINKSHLGYNPSIDFGDVYRPDHLLTFGYRELAVFGKNNNYVNELEVYPVGNFYFDYLVNRYQGDDKILTARKKYAKVVCVSAEFDLEDQLIPLINAAAQKLGHFLFLYMPRNKMATDYDQYQFEPNIIITDWLNSYQVIRQSDFHTCVRSTTALEAVALGTQNILINLKNYAVTYFQHVLVDKRITLFVDTEEQYINALTTFSLLPKSEVMQSADNSIVPNFTSNLQNAITKILTT